MLKIITFVAPLLVMNIFVSHWVRFNNKQFVYFKGVNGGCNNYLTN